MSLKTEHCLNSASFILRCGSEGATIYSYLNATIGSTRIARRAGT